MYREVEISEDEYHREKELTEAALATLKNPEREQVIEIGNCVECITEAWMQATKEERRDMLGLMLDAVYVDMPTGKVVGLKPKLAFLPLFNLEAPLEASEAILVTGDPEGGRGH